MKTFTVINHTKEPVKVVEADDGILQIVVGDESSVNIEDSNFGVFNAGDYERKMLACVEEESEFRRALLEKLERLITKLPSV